ncbi:hypothetical protein AN286_05435 [Aliarcobacter cryaerophilus ATCC 43158]|uniref:Membrane protein n=1 Tax=Aliarcobacter cryaerophilus ATCC 43158 TaxID=1032070 RepID=A0AAD0TSQ5_9BACT|nr:hypothetical protein [Aliarcobacter cryaerophilus]AYJ79611.1 putative membrane protein [Aliarcobacter cryaerophilus ATCC 43158]PRM95183.1 hypothetical protein CJ667_09155 [Aliarcobacter cryaerophilus]QCZ23855.1 hypothetical protein AN286_05435 [Aliarcobacter cryaerophilus ATCC 43158]
MRFNTTDLITKKTIKDSFFEEWNDLITKILFWTIIFSPYLIVLNDIYQNKLMHDAKFWIKRAGLYFAFIVFTYFFIGVFSQANAQYLIAINLFLIYVMMFAILKAQSKYGYLLKAKCDEYKPSIEEIENIIKVQNSDENEENINKKKKFRIMFGLVGTLFYLIVLFNIPIASAFIMSILIIGYDIFEQKYFKRDITELFWKKRITYYILVLLPILFIINYIIYDGF